MKRQLDELAEKTSGAPSDITDMKERFEDIEKDMTKKSKDKQGTSERLDSIEKDLNHLMGRGDTSNVSGIPTVVRVLYMSNQKLLL